MLVRPFLSTKRLLCDLYRRRMEKMSHAMQSFLFLARELLTMTRRVCERENAFHGVRIAIGFSV